MSINIGKFLSLPIYFFDHVDKYIKNGRKPVYETEINKDLKDALDFYYLDNRFDYLSFKQKQKIVLKDLASYFCEKHGDEILSGIGGETDKKIQDMLFTTVAFSDPNVFETYKLSREIPKMKDIQVLIK